MRNFVYREATSMNPIAKFGLLGGCLIFAGATLALAQENSPRLAQVVALDECDPTTFNAALGPDFCKNVALAAFGYATTLSDLFAKAAKGTPDPGWDFEPDTVKMKEGATLSVVDQGGEPHTFTEGAQFGGGFIGGLNHGEATVPECKASTELRHLGEGVRLATLVDYAKSGP